MATVAQTDAALTATRLNLGCGEFKRPGYINVDATTRCDPDVCHDLNVLPYPFAENQFEVIEASHVLEHLDNPLVAMTELHRIAQPGARLLVKVPHFSRGFTHADHRRGFDVTFPYYFNPAFTPGYCGKEMRLDRLTFSWFAQPHLKKTYMPAFDFYAGSALARVLDFLANLSPVICSRIWCFWVGGFEEVEFEFTVVK